VLSADYGRYMDAQQAINFRIHEAFEALGVEFAYPTQTLWLAGNPGPDAQQERLAA
jgi:small-conductance mechanosensitive channel